jgi:hypothetical protein
MQRQARAPKTQPFGAEAFEASDGTVSRWLGMAGFLINSRGTTLMVDPLLGGFYVGTQAAKTSFATMIADMARGHPA